MHLKLVLDPWKKKTEHQENLEALAQAQDWKGDHLSLFYLLMN